MINSYKIIDERLEGGRDAILLYIVGFIISILLTIIPYYIVTSHLFTEGKMIIAIAFFAFVQLFVQVSFFLHLHKHTRPHWNIIVFCFTLLIVSFLVVGSLWIMYHLNINMMGVSPFNSNEGYLPQ